MEATTLFGDISKAKSTKSWANVTKAFRPGMKHKAETEVANINSQVDESKKEDIAWKTVHRGPSGEKIIKIKKTYLTSLHITDSQN